VTTGPHGPGQPRVLQLLPALGDGGVERSAVEMARHLSGLGLDNIVASAGGDLVGEIEAAGAMHVRLPVGSKSPARMLANARVLAGLIDREAVDIVHARSRAPAWAGVLASRMSKRRPAFVTTFHGVYGHRSALKRWYNAVMLRGPLVIANSEYIRGHIVAVYGVPAERIALAPRGVDPAVFDPALIPATTVESIRAEFQVPPGATLILLVGRLTRWKGQGVFLDALASLRDLPLVGVLVGEGGMRAELETRARDLGVADRVRFPGSRRDIPALFAAADLAVSASTEPEAFGRVTIEAMAMETPVVATAHGGSLETVLPGRTGWLVPPGDAAALAAAIRRAVADPGALAAMGAAGRSHVLARFTVSRTVEAEFDVYRRLMAGSAR
jgi:glycosyltransferase involved in cell wall biosynthesis